MPILSALSTCPLPDLKLEQIEVRGFSLLIHRGYGDPLRLNHSTHGAETLKPVKLKVEARPRDPNAQLSLPDFWRVYVKLEKPHLSKTTES